MPLTSPSYNSSRVQRASRINSIENARLEKQLNHFEQSMIHQCRLLNRSIRLTSQSADYIKSSSGHSPEAWVPSRSPTSSPETKEPSPFFLYGERIWSRKKRKLYRSFSTSSTLQWEDVRPQCGWDDVQEAVVTPEMVISDDNNKDNEDWENDTDEVTKKIFKNQARSSMAGHRHVYQSSSEVMVSQAARHVRGLVRQIRISGSPHLNENDLTVARDLKLTRAVTSLNQVQNSRRPLLGEDNDVNRSDHHMFHTGTSDVSTRATNYKQLNRPKSVITC